MAHVPLPDGVPGMPALLAYKPATGGRIAALFHEVLRGDGPLTPAEREVIAAHVSARNDCDFCARSHAATARHLPHGPAVAGALLHGPAGSSVDPRLRALLRLAEGTADGGRNVTPDLVDDARAAGATDEAIHDTVLIAALFAMANRYVDGLAAFTPDEDAAYDAMGERMAREGYRR